MRDATLRESQVQSLLAGTGIGLLTNQEEECSGLGCVGKTLQSLVHGDTERLQCLWQYIIRTGRDAHIVVTAVFVVLSTVWENVFKDG